MLGYLVNARIGAFSYNIGHSYTIPAFLAMAGWFSSFEWMLPLAIIWFAHIGMDRAFGYGLKYDDDFTHTHLGVIGRG